MIYKTVFKRGSKYLAKIIFDDVGEKWCSTTSAVYTFAQKSFEEDEQVDVEYTVKNGQYSVSKIKKVGGGSTKTEAPTSESKTGQYKCEDCGTELKDGKYKKCYTCNQKNPVKTEKSSYGSNNLAIQKESVMHSACIAVRTLSGLVQDPKTLWDAVEYLYDKAYKKLFG